MSERGLLILTRHLSQLGLTVLLSVVSIGCMPFPRYAYLAETRVEAEGGSDGFSTQVIRRAEVVAADVAKESGMRSGLDEPQGYLEPNRMKSAALSPPRRFLSVHTGKLSYGLPLDLTLELSDDGRVLYFSLADADRGTASPLFDRIYELLKARVEAAFPGLAIVHEPRTLGPIWSLPP